MITVNIRESFVQFDIEHCVKRIDDCVTYFLALTYPDLQYRPENRRIKNVSMAVYFVWCA